MKTSLAALVLLVVSLILNLPSTALAQGTAFTYQGQLDSSGAPANGSYDFAFTLYTTNVAGSPIAGPVTNTAVGVTNGLFTTTIDFGNVFFGTSNWLEIAVSTHSASSFTTLAPRQQLTPVPYAITAANVSGVISLAQLPASVITNGAAGVNISGTFSGNGAGLSNVVATSLAVPTQFQNTNVYSTFGTYAITIPPSVNIIQVKLWGAGGGVSAEEHTPGGAGAYASTTLAVSPGQTYVVVVGQTGSNSGGGSGANDGSGGTGDIGGSMFSAGGGQASSLFQFTGSDYIMEAVAGAGGGAGAPSGAGADATASGSGSGYATNATTTGETNLDLMGGTGGIGQTTSSSAGGGGGGGYGGGAGGVPGGGGGGGGSYGTITIGGNGGVPGNTNDPAYFYPAGYSSNSGLAVVTFGFTNVMAVYNYENGVTLAGTFSGDGSGLTSLPAGVVTNTETGVTLGGTFSGNGHGLASLNTANLSGTLQPGNFAATTVTNFPDATGSLPATFSFATHGGRLLITTSGSGTTSFAGTTIAMTVELDSVAIGTNFVYVTSAGTHMPFISKTFVQTGVAAGNHTITLAVPPSTITTSADTFNVTVQELPY